MLQVTALILNLTILAAGPASSPTGSAAERPPDLSRMNDVAQLRAYALGMWKQLAAAKRELAEANDKIAELGGQIINLENRLKPYAKVEQAIENAKQAAALTPILDVNHPAEGMVGRIGIPAAPNEEFYCKVIQIIDDNNLIGLVNNLSKTPASTFWIDGLPTGGMVDDQAFLLNRFIFKVMGTKSYTTTLGAKNRSLDSIREGDQPAERVRTLPILRVLMWNDVIMTIKRLDAKRWAIIIGATVFAFFVWPTFYRYDSLAIGQGTHFPVRINRLSGNAEKLTLSGWQRMNRPDAIKAALPKESIIALNKFMVSEPRGNVSNYRFYNGSGRPISEIGFALLVEREPKSALDKALEGALGDDEPVDKDSNARRFIQPPTLISPPAPPDSWYSGYLSLPNSPGNATPQNSMLEAVSATWSE